jgi:hypothetical protein
MTHYFREPKSFRGVNCKAVPGERARKACREWNKLISLRDKLRAEGRIEELEELERPYKELWEFEKELFAPRKKAKQRKKTRKTATLQLC